MARGGVSYTPPQPTEIKLVKNRNKLTTIEKTAVFEMEQPEVDPKGEPSWSERVKEHREHRGNECIAQKQPDCRTPALIS